MSKPSGGLMTGAGYGGVIELHHELVEPVAERAAGLGSGLLLVFRRHVSVLDALHDVDPCLAVAHQGQFGEQAFEVDVALGAHPAVAVDAVGFGEVS